MFASSSTIYSDTQTSPNNHSNTLSAKLNNIQSRSYLRLIAELADINIVISSEFRNERIDASHDALEAIKLINKNTKKQDLLDKRINNILVVASECRIKNAFTTNDMSYLSNKLSLIYSSVSLDTILEAFEVVSNSEINTSGINLSYPVTIHVKSKEVKEILQAVAVAEGWLINQKPDNSLWLSLIHI